MNEPQLNKRLREEVESLAPNRLEELLAACDTPPAPRKDGRVINLNPRRQSPWKRIAALAAMLILIIGIGTFMGVNAMSRTVLTFDVNPSVSVTVNGFNRVCQVRTNNSDAAVLLANEDLEGKTLEQAVETLTEDFIRAGYITNASNGILVTVQDASDSRAEQLQQLVVKSVETAADKTSLRLAVLYQQIDGDQVSLSGISAGKTALVQTLAKNAEGLDEAELQSLSIQDLFYVMDTLAAKPVSAKLTGTVSRANYQDSNVVAELAAQICPANVSTDAVATVLDCFDQELAFVANVVTDTAEYAYTVSATSGEILDTIVTPTVPPSAPEYVPEPVDEPEPTVEPEPSAAPETPAEPTAEPVEQSSEPVDPSGLYEYFKDFADLLDRII